MKRQDFLNNYWSSYVSATGDLWSLARWFRAKAWERASKKNWIGGQLKGVSSSEGAIRLWLSGQGHDVIFEANAVGICPDLEGDSNPRLVDPADFFIAGDQLAIQVDSLRGAWPAGPLSTETLKVALLTPSRAELSTSKLSFKTAQRWQEFLTVIRSYFQSLGLVEMNTPTLVVCPGMEVHLEPFSSEWTIGSWKRQLFLPTSPELHLKKLLAMGWTDVFEIKSCFRNGEISQHHEPEFHMLEWYRAYANLNLVEQDLIQMLEHLRKMDLVQGGIGQVQRWSVSELFEHFLNFCLKPETSWQELIEVAQKQGLTIEQAQGMNWDDLFHWLFLERIEREIHQWPDPVIVYNYPPSQAALARLTPDGWADRFELYWRGLEIANAFNELNDPDEQESRMVREQKLRQDLGRADVPIDQEFLKGLRAGLPPTGGIALGLERLFMAANRIQNIDEVRAFSASRLQTRDSEV